MIRCNCGEMLPLHSGGPAHVCPTIDKTVSLNADSQPLVTKSYHLGANDADLTPMSNASGDDTTSLTDVLAWERKASIYMAMAFPHSPEQAEALDAVKRLADLARTALSHPTERQLGDALRNDPYCLAAYAYGANEERRRIEGEHRHV